MLQQGIGWLTRKAIGVATITLAVTQHIEPNADDPSNAPITKINIEQTATGGIKSTESRTTDWRVREHKDRTFGQCAAQSRLVRGQKGADGKIRPVFEVQSEPKEEKIQRFLRGEITVDGEEDPEGFLVEDAQEKDGVTYPEGEGLWLQSFVRSEEAPWSAEQVCILPFCCKLSVVKHILIIVRSGALRRSMASDSTAVVSSLLPKTASTSSDAWYTTSRFRRVAAT